MDLKPRPSTTDGVNTTTTLATPLHIQANRFDLLSRVADGLAHEVKNPIHAAVINLELLRRRVDGGERDRAHERIRVLEDEIARVHGLVDALLRLLRPCPEYDSAVELDQAVASMMPVLEALGKVSRSQVRYRPAGAGAFIAIARDALYHAVLNLVANALEAMQPTGGFLDLVGVLGPTEVHLEIRDTGPGIRPEDLARIGTPGFSTRAGRQGMGIAVARTLLEDAGGRLELLDPGESGGGTTFLLAFARAAGA